MDNKKYDVVLVQMPFSWLQPSIALALLKSDMNAKGIKSKIRHSNLFFVDQIQGRRHNSFLKFLPQSIFSGWEFAFAPFTSFKPAVPPERVLDEFCYETSSSCYVEDFVIPRKDFRKLIGKDYAEFMEFIGEFLEEEAEKILSMEPKVVGFSIMTEQRNASFAMCRLLKKKNPNIITVLGGGVCNDEAAEQILRIIPDLDYVFAGDGDGKFAEGMELILAGKESELSEKVPYFYKRGAKPVLHTLQDMDQSPIPDYDDFREDLAAAQYIAYTEFIPFVEGSRGCWWGEKGRCRFCGLHYSKESLQYREKSSDRLWREIDYLMQKYDTQKIMMTDCILSRKFINELPDEPPEHRKNYQIFAENKTNISLDDMKKLRANGFVKLQPGIEALQDDLLKHMNKGASALTQIGFLKNARICGIYCLWNLILALPGEKKEWWMEMVETMKKIHHLQPPTTIARMLLVRGSEFELHLEDYSDTKKLLTPLYRATVPDDEEYAWKMSDRYAMPGVVVDPEIKAAITLEGQKWAQDFYNESRLFYKPLGETIMVFDQRNRRSPKHYVLIGLEKEVFMMTESEIGLKALKEKIDKNNEAPADPEAFNAVIDDLVSKDILLRSGNKVLNITLPEEVGEYTICHMI